MASLKVIGKVFLILATVMFILSIVRHDMHQSLTRVLDYLRERHLTSEELHRALPYCKGMTPYHTIELFWTRDPYNDILAYVTVGYRVYRSTGGSYESLIPKGVVVMGTRYRDVSAIPGITYSYAATSVDKSGLESRYSEPSNKATIPINTIYPIMLLKY